MLLFPYRESCPGVSSPSSANSPIPIQFLFPEAFKPALEPINIESEEASAFLPALLPMAIVFSKLSES